MSPTTSMTTASGSCSRQSSSSQKAMPPVRRSARQCANCGRMESPEWRKGPDGLRNLCNRCGLRWSKAQANATKTATAVATFPPITTAARVAAANMGFDPGPSSISGFGTAAVSHLHMPSQQPPELLLDSVDPSVITTLPPRQPSSNFPPYLN
jgi:hypothetical protein